MTVLNNSAVRLLRQQKREAKDTVSKRRGLKRTLIMSAVIVLALLAGYAAGATSQNATPSRPSGSQYAIEGVILALKTYDTAGYTHAVIAVNNSTYPLIEITPLSVSADQWQRFLFAKPGDAFFATIANANGVWVATIIVVQGQDLTYATTSG